MFVYFEETVIKDYIILQTEVKTMIIFRKKNPEESQLQKSENESPRFGLKREDSPKVWSFLCSC